MPHQPRNRVVYGAAALLVLGAGLFSRSQWAGVLPAWVTQYAGDTLWALLVYGLACLIWPRAAAWKLAAGVLVFSFAVEFSQLYQAAWLNKIRSNRGAALVLGRGFLWTDLLCYSAGVLVGLGLDLTVRLGLGRRGTDHR